MRLNPPTLLLFLIPEQLLLREGLLRSVPLLRLRLLQTLLLFLTPQQLLCMGLLLLLQLLQLPAVLCQMQLPHQS